MGITYPFFRQKHISLYVSMKLAVRNANSPYYKRILIVVILLSGIVLRFIPYINAPALWFDELTSALTIINHSFSQMFHQFADIWPMPYGFFVIEKLFFYAFGSSEYSLRLFPLICSIISIFLFYSLAKQILCKESILFAMILFSLSARLIYFSSELKPYSSDVVIVLSLLLVFKHLNLKAPSIKHSVYLGILGAISIWVSFPSIFVLAGHAIYTGFLCLFNRKLRTLSIHSIIFSIWGVSFLIYYYSYLHPLIRVCTGSFAYWQKAFAPFPLHSFSDLQWYPRVFLNIFTDPVGLYLPIFGALTFLVGCFYLFKSKRYDFFILISPMLITLIASIFHKYPITSVSKANANTGRLLLFITPLLILFIAEGCYVIIKKIFRNSSVFYITFMILLILNSAPRAIRVVLKPNPAKNIKTTLIYFKKHFQKTISFIITLT